MKSTQNHSDSKINSSLLADQKVSKEGAMISEYLFGRIRELSDKNLTHSEIAKELGINRKTVGKYLKSNTPPQYGPRKKRTRLDPFKGFESRMEELITHNPNNSAREIYELLLEEGYKGSERTVNRRFSKLQSSRPQERFFQQSFEPGEQSQFDFKERVSLPFVHGEQVVHLLFGTLPHSNTCWIKSYPFRSYECFIDGIHSFFEKVGGMTRNIRIDNLSPCVVKVLKGNDRIYTESFKRAQRYYGFKVLPCAPGKGSDKGDVERDIRTYANRIKNFVKNKNIVFRDWEHLNEFLDSFMEKRQKELSLSQLNEEKKHFKALPGRDEDILSRVGIGSSNGYGTVRINKSAYSVPDEAIGSPCKTVMGAYEVCIYRLSDQKQCLARHPRQPEGVSSILLEHVLPSLVRKPGAMLRWAHKEILFPNSILEKSYNHLKKQDPLSSEREYLKIINLVQHVSLEELSLSLQLQLESGELSFDTTKALVLSSPASVIDLDKKRQQKPLNPQLSQYDSLIPKTGESE